MSDTPTTIEEVAYKLLELICAVEQKDLTSSTAASSGKTKPDRKYILDTYAECLSVVKDPVGHLTKAR